MNVMLNRLDPHLPDPVESRRRAAGRMVRIAYSTVVFGLLGFFVIYFARPLVYLGGFGIVSSPRFVVSLPYVVQVSHMNVTAGNVVQVGEEIGQVRSPQHDGVVATYMQALADIVGRRAELRIKGSGGAGLPRIGSTVSAADRGGRGSHRGVGCCQHDLPG